LDTHVVDDCWLRMRRLIRQFSYTRRPLHARLWESNPTGRQLMESVTAMSRLGTLCPVKYSLTESSRRHRSRWPGLAGL